MDLDLDTKNRDDGFRNVNHPKQPRRIGEGKRPVFKLNKQTGEIIQRYYSSSNAGYELCDVIGTYSEGISQNIIHFCRGE